MICLFHPDGTQNIFTIRIPITDYRKKEKPTVNIGNGSPTHLSDENILLRHDDILEGDAACIRAALSHVQLLAAGRDPGGVAIHNEAGESLAGRALGVRVGARQDKVEAGHPTVGDPHLLAVDDPAVALLLRLGLDAGHIGASTRLWREQLLRK